MTDRDPMRPLNPLKLAATLHWGPDDRVTSRDMESKRVLDHWLQQIEHFDPIFAPEYVEAMWSMLQRDAADDFVLGTGESHSVRELVDTVRKNVSIDWTVRETVRAKLRVLVKRILRKYGYPPDKQEKATQTVLEQAEVISEEWAAE